MNGLRPLPPRIGFGFEAPGPLSVRGYLVRGYRYEEVAGHHNYFFTPEAYCWPEPPVEPFSGAIDAFSPNMNKQLHIGHLRNLALATSLQRLLPRARFVSLLGYSQGIEDKAEDALHEWCEFVGYERETWRDIDLVEDGPSGSVPGRDGEGKYAGCLLWDGSEDPVVLVRSDGRATYALHDLLFRNVVPVDYYLTGAEQADHFASLGLADKHLPMGLILDPVTGKKMKSRDGNAASASEALKAIEDALDETPERRKLAWNVMAWNLLHASRAKNVSFDPIAWTRPDAPGMRISYAVARLFSALGDEKAVEASLEEADMPLMGTVAYGQHAYNMAVSKMEPSFLAAWALDAARLVGKIWHGEKLAGGRPSRVMAAQALRGAMCEALDCLGMFPLRKV